MNKEDEEEEYEIIKIDLDIFKQELKKYRENKKIIPNNIQIKYNEIIKSNNCFSVKYDPKSVWEKKKYKNMKNNNIYKQKLHIFTPPNNNNKNNKILIGLLNKITTSNEEIIINKINEIINKNNLDLIDIVINFIGKKYDILYIKILKIFEKYDNKIIYNYINNYIDNNIWYPYSLIKEKNILNNEYYDEYCNYIKWKNSQLNIFKIIYYMYNQNNDLYEKIFINLSKKIYDEINVSINNNYYKYIIDYLLEILEIFKNKIDNKIIDNLKECDLKRIDSSTRFLILNIINK